MNNYQEKPFTVTITGMFTIAREDQSETGDAATGPEPRPVK